MPRLSLPKSVIITFLMGVPLIALFYLGSQLMLFPFFPFDMFDWVSRVLPGHLITSGIDVIVGVIRFFGLKQIDQAAKTIEMGIALFLFAICLAVLGMAITLTLRVSPKKPLLWGSTLGLMAFLAIATIEVSLGELTIASTVISAPFLLYGQPPLE